MAENAKFWHKEPEVCLRVTIENADYNSKLSITCIFIVVYAL
jgi:hypothetical protein